MVHPYFKAAHWEKRWIDTAQKLVCDKFEHSYVFQSQSEGSEKSDSNIVIPKPSKVCPLHSFHALTVLSGQAMCIKKYV